MPIRIISCVSLPPATIMSVPIYDYANANEELANMGMAHYYSCCGKSICGGCIHSFCESGNFGTCPFCKADRISKTDAERVEEIMRRVEVNDAGAFFMLANHYELGNGGLRQDSARAMELYARAAELGSSKAHFHLGNMYHEGGNLNKAKFHLEAAAVAGDDAARYNLGCNENESGDMERAVKHWTIAASAGYHKAMHNLLIAFNNGLVSRKTIDSTLTAYNNVCVEMRSEARDAYIRSRSN
jgi:TPR repeat protein